MTPYEWLALAYFVAVALTAPPTESRRRGWLFVCGASGLVLVARLTMPWAARAWLPQVYLLLGYWIPAAFTPPHRTDRFERWLQRADARFGFQIPNPRPQSSGSSSGIRNLGSGILELAYLCCYPLVPAAFALVFVWGSHDDVVRFWMAVLTAGYGCYGTLPWTAVRPPRLRVEPADRVTTGERAIGLAALNAFVLARVSHQLVTFPSGHVAVSTAASLAVGRLSLVAGCGFGVMALIIAVAAVKGRYHYFVDVLLGLVLGAVAALITG